MKRNREIQRRRDVKAQVKRSTLYAVRCTKKGFTLVEMITVLAIMAIIMAFAVPMFSRFTAGTRLGTASRDISTALRTARSYAITQRADGFVNFDLDDQRYRVFYVCTEGTNIVTNVVAKAFNLPDTIKMAKGNTSEVTQTNNSFEVNFGSTGTGTGLTVWLWDMKGRTNQVIIVSTTGRVRIEKK